ncbi:MAG: hypothetical protein Kow00123_24520 [Anaerolineales bacterium]
MESSQLQVNGYVRTVMDAIPAAVFVVDRRVQILDCNAAGLEMLGTPGKESLPKLCGNALQCVHALQSPGGCGTSPLCSDCALRNSVRESMAGDRVIRRKTQMLLVRHGQPQEFHLLISTAPFEYKGQRLVLATLEDITELEELRHIVPICANCKRVRTDEEYWESVEAYVSKHSNLDFSHGICPDCARVLYPDLFTDEGERSSGQTTRR